MPSRDGQRAASVVVPDEGLAAGGGVWSSAVDPGVPLGPGLLATCSVFHGMLSVPRSPREDSKRQHHYSDNGERSKVHAALRVS